MKIILKLGRKRDSIFGPAGILAAVMALGVFLAWLPAWGGQPSSQGKVLHLDARGLDLLLRSDPNLLLVDVRTPEELNGPLGKIPRSRSVFMQELEKNPEQFPRDKTLVLICRTGHRSLEAAELLAEHGYVVYSVDGGMQAWNELHPPALPTARDTPREQPVTPGPIPDRGKPAPRENNDQHSPEKFFDSNMGC